MEVGLLHFEWVFRENLWQQIWKPILILHFFCLFISLFAVLRHHIQEYLPYRKTGRIIGRLEPNLKSQKAPS